jgi:hypothetical protein
MHTLADDYRSGLLTAQAGPCLSVYQPTHRHAPDNRQDPIRFRNLLKTLEASLRREYPGAEVSALLRPFEELAGERPFWEHALEGMAALGAPGFFRIYRLQRPVPELAVVAASFHTKPLLRQLQSAGGYHVLGLNRHQIRLFEGDRDVLDEIEPAEGVPRTSADVLGDADREPHLTVASYGGAGAAMHHGHGDTRVADKDAERFFRAVDQAVLAHHSRPAGRPLILAALPEHHDLFRRVSQNPLLLPDGIPVHPDDLALDALRDRAWQVVAPRHQERLTGLADEFREAVAAGRGTDDLASIGAAAAQGRVGTLLIAAERTVPGTVDAETGAVSLADLGRPDVDDLLDDLAELVLARGGDAVVVPDGSMPSGTGAAAVFRY